MHLECKNFKTLVCFKLHNPYNVLYTVIWELFVVKKISWFKSTTKIKRTKFLLQCILNTTKIYGQYMRGPVAVVQSSSSA